MALDLKPLPAIEPVTTPVTSSSSVPPVPSAAIDVKSSGPKLHAYEDEFTRSPPNSGRVLYDPKQTDQKLNRTINRKIDSQPNLDLRNRHPKPLVREPIRNAPRGPRDMDRRPHDGYDPIPRPEMDRLNGRPRPVEQSHASKDMDWRKSMNKVPEPRHPQPNRSVPAATSVVTPAVASTPHLSSSSKPASFQSQESESDMVSDRQSITSSQRSSPKPVPEKVIIVQPPPASKTPVAPKPAVNEESPEVPVGTITFENTRYRHNRSANTVPESQASRQAAPASGRFVKPEQTAPQTASHKTGDASRSDNRRRGSPGPRQSDRPKDVPHPQHKSNDRNESILKKQQQETIIKHLKSNEPSTHARDRTGSQSEHHRPKEEREKRGFDDDEFDGRRRRKGSNSLSTHSDEKDHRREVSIWNPFFEPIVVAPDEILSDLSIL